MTDKELAEEKYQEHIIKERCYISNPEDEIYTDGFLDGLAEGRKEKWHNLRKDPDDLPTVTNSQFLWMCWINPYGNMSYHQGYYDDKGFYWIDEQFCTKHYLVSDIIAWCELPNFEE